MKKALVFALLMCGLANAQERTGIAIDPAAGNVAALFTMTDEQGRLRNLELMETIFRDKSLGFVSERHHNVPSTYIYERLTQLASTLDPEATLLLYFNSHGGGSGDRFAMTAQGGSFKFSKAIQALAKPNRPIKRLIFLVDTCHAEGSIQDSLKQDGELLRNIKIATPTNYLPEIPEAYSSRSRPFVGIFNLKGNNIDFCEDSGAYEQILIISSSSVEDVSMRGTFAARLASTFRSVRDDRRLTVGEFLKRFAESHGSSGQQPFYKILPDNSMFGELLLGPWPAQTIPIVDHGGDGTFGTNYIPIPTR